MAVQIPITITLRSNNALMLESPFFGYNAPAGTQWDNNQSELIVTRPEGYEAYQGYLIMANSVVKTTIAMGDAIANGGIDTYMLARPLTASAELQVEFAFYDGDVWVAQTNIGILQFNERIPSDDFAVGELNPTPVLTPGPIGPRGANGYTPYIGSNGNWWINGVDTGVSASGGGGGISSVVTDGVTVFGDGTEGNPITSPRQGLKIAGPYATTTDIPPPYDASMIYLVGSASPYAEYVVNADGVLIEIGSATVDLSNYYTKTQTDSMITNLDDEVAALGNEVNDLSSQISGYVVMQPPDIFEYAGSNTFTLSKAPAYMVNVFVLNGANQFYMLQSGDYSVTGTALTITNPTLAEGMSVKAEYVA